MKNIKTTILIVAALMVATTQHVFSQENKEEWINLKLQQRPERLAEELYENMISFEKQKKEIRKLKAEVAKVDSLQNKIIEDSITLADNFSEIEMLTDSIDSLNEEMEPLRQYRKKYLIAEFENLRNYLALPYSKIDMDKLNQWKEDFSEFSKDKKVIAKIAEIDRAIENKNNVIEMENAINTPYDVKQIKKARDSFKKLETRKKTFSEAQWEEFDNLDIYLSRYKPSVKAFQDIIQKVNSIVSEYTDNGNLNVISQTAKSRIISLISEVFTPYEDREIKLGIYSIPYLKDRFEKYRKWATENPFKKDRKIEQIIDDIMNLNPN